jgi:hypothetical protein
MIKPLLIESMGGFGSGRYPRSGRAKATVSRCRSFSADWMNREGILDAGFHGTISWSRNGDKISTIGVQRVSMADGRDALRLHYTTKPRTGDDREHDYRVPLTYTDCNFGGERPWFRCPNQECGERVGKLYSAPGSDLYLCRHCHDLGYKSSQKSGKPGYENLIKPLEKADAAAERFAENPFDREALREYYETRRALDRGSSREFDTPSFPEFRGVSSFEEWADRLFSRTLGYGHYGQCTATAKTTGDRCRQSAVGEHGKCYYHGGAPGSGIGENQRDHAAEHVEQLLAEVEEERECDRSETQDLLAELD